MAYKTSDYTRALNEFVRQIQRLSRDGLVKTWRTWDATPVSDDEIAASMCPVVRITVDGSQASLSATSATDSVYVQDTRIPLSIETWVAGYDQRVPLDLWGELREAIFHQTEATRLARTDSLAALGVLDVIEDVPVLPQGVQAFEGGVIYSKGQVTLWLDTGA